MKSLNIIKGNINNPEILESVKCNLDLVGVRAFTVDFETNVVTVMTPGSIADKDITCALLKAGLHCACNQKCNLFKK